MYNPTDPAPARRFFYALRTRSHALRREHPHQCPRRFICPQTPRKALQAPARFRQHIISAPSAPVIAPFLRLLRYSPSPSEKPVSTVFPSSKYRLAMSSALISCSPLFCGEMTTS